MKRSVVFIIAAIFFAHLGISAQVNDYSPVYTKLNINRIATIIYNNGKMDYDYEKSSAAFEYPKGSGKTIVKQSGFLWGGKINGEIRVGGTASRTGIKPGRILQGGIPENPDSEDVRVFRIRVDYKNSDLLNEIQCGEGTKEEIIARYERDWNEWPADAGAPYEDTNCDGVYDPNIDIPGVPGADQTIWFVANDLDPGQAKYLYGALPMGVELQTTIWAYKMCEVMDQVFYKKYKIINKNQDGYDFDEMYCGQWCEPSIGDSNNDLVGCDTLLQMCYAYNGTTEDYVYGNISPAIGYTLLGPMVDGAPYDVGYSGGKKHPGKKNLGITSFSFFVNNEPEYADPILGEFERGALNVYNLFCDGIQICGNPLNGNGYYDGIQHPPGERRMLMGTGPFNLTNGDSMEVLFVVIVGGNRRGISNLDALSQLKWYGKVIRENYLGIDFEPPSPPSPVVEIGQLDSEIVLFWGHDMQRVIQTEEFNSSGYKFQGYNVYQLPKYDCNKSDAIRITTLDTKDGIKKIEQKYYDFSNKKMETHTEQYGSDSGVERYIKIDFDYINNQPLFNGTQYYYAVSAYSCNAEGEISSKEYESPLIIVEGIPQNTQPGIRYNAEFGEKIEPHHYAGDGEADIDIMIIDPSKLTGHQYEITFHESAGQLHWNLEDLTSEEIKLTNQTNITGTDEYYIVDGFRIIITETILLPMTNDPMTNDQLTIDDKYMFASPGIIDDEDLAKEDVQQINVFPNPYYGGRTNTISPNQNYVTFNHLPAKAKIKIFNLAGHVIRSIEKEDDSQFCNWDLTTGHGCSVPSGLYLIYIEMPDLGEVKILKLLVIAK